MFFCSFMHISIYLCNPNSTKNMFYYWKLFLINKIATVIVRILLPKVRTKETPSNSHLNLDTQSNGIILIKILILSAKTVETSAVAATKTPQLHHFFFKVNFHKILTKNCFSLLLKNTSDIFVLTSPNHTCTIL